MMETVEYEDLLSPSISPSRSSVSSSPILSSAGEREVAIGVNLEKSAFFEGTSSPSNGNFKVPVSGKQSVFESDLFVQLFGLDLRSIAAARIGLSTLLILDCYVRSQYTYDHYTDLGVLPSQQVIDSNPYHWSLNFLNSTVYWANFLFILQVISSFCLLIGYKTRIANVFSWILLTSVHIRNPLVLNGGDDFFRLMIFWLMFLPSGAKYSVDSAINLEYSNKPSTSNIKTTPISPSNQPGVTPVTDSQGNYYLSWATVGYLMQFCIVYYSTAYLKTGDPWNKDYSSVWIALHLDQFATRLGIWLRQYVVLGQMLTWFTIKFEWYGPLLFFVPLKKFHGPLRFLGCLGFAAMHIGFGSCLELGFFMYIPIMSVMAFLPSWFWDHLLGYIATPARGSVSINYRSTSSESLKRALTLYKMFFLLHSTPISPVYRTSDDLSDANPIYQEMVESNSWLCVVTSHSKYYGYNACLELLKASPVHRYTLYPLANTSGFKRFYNWFVNRPTLNTALHCTDSIYPQVPQIIRRGWIIEIFALFLVVFVLNWNFAGLHDYSVPDSVRWVAPALRLEQYWSMFSPYPSKDNGWMVIPAELNNGTVVDLYTGGKPVTYDRPEMISQTFPTQRWRKYLMNLQSSSHKDRRLFYGRYLCREWNWFGRHEENEKIKSFKIIFMFEMIADMPTLNDPNPTPSPIEPIELWSHVC